MTVTWTSYVSISSLYICVNHAVICSKYLVPCLGDTVLDMFLFLPIVFFSNEDFSDHHILFRLCWLKDHLKKVFR